MFTWVTNFLNTFDLIFCIIFWRLLPFFHSFVYFAVVFTLAARPLISGRSLNFCFSVVLTAIDLYIF